MTFQDVLKNLSGLLGKLEFFLLKMKLVDPLIQVESKGDDYAIGDTHLQNKAYGCLQIRKPCVDDVNARFGTNHSASDMLGNRRLSIWVFERYMDIYATAQRLGRKPTLEDMARIWNGGPFGYKKEITVKYWNEVKKLL